MDLESRISPSSKSSPGSVFCLAEEGLKIFTNCVDRCVQLVEARNFLSENYNRNCKYYLSTISNSISTRSPLEISADLIRFGKELTELNKFPSQCEVGVIRFEMGLILRKYVAKVNDCIEITLKKVIDHFLTFCEVKFNELFSLRASIMGLTSKVDEYVVVLERYRFALSRREQLGTAYEYLQSLKNIVIDDHTTVVIEAVHNKHITLTSAWYQFQDAVEKFSDSLEENTKYFTRELENRFFFYQDCSLQMFIV